MMISFELIDMYFAKTIADNRYVKRYVYVATIRQFKMNPIFNYYISIYNSPTPNKKNLIGWKESKFYSTIVNE